MYCDAFGDPEDSERCTGPVKPNIVFFGESLPFKFMSSLLEVKDKCDLLIILGSSLGYSPFNSIVTRVRADCPKVLINVENSPAQDEFDFKNAKYPERLFLQGNCDDVVGKIVMDCGWDEEFK